MSNSFSVVTPSYNQGQLIRATIESLLSQFSIRLANRSENELGFLTILVMNCLRADLHWNKKISASTLRMLGGRISVRLRRV